MRYLMLVCTADDAVPGDRPGPGEPDIDTWVETHDGSGARVTGNRLRPAAEATTVRRRGDDLLVTAGPFAETAEWIAGFDVIEAADHDEAVAIAAAHPMARGGRIELRRYWLDDED